MSSAATRLICSGDLDLQLGRHFQPEGLTRVAGGLNPKSTDVSTPVWGGGGLPVNIRLNELGLILLVCSEAFRDFFQFYGVSIGLQ